MEEKRKLTQEEIQARIDFLSSVKCNHTPHKYIDITGDLIQGTLLARIMYWFEEGKNKKTKVRIFKDGYFWIAKQRRDWWEEIRITERQYDKAIKELEKKGFVELAKYKFNSMPTIHIRPDYDNINTAVNNWRKELEREIIDEYDIELQKMQNGSCTKCNSQGNDIKCNSGVTQEGNLLTYITNNEYSNNNYNSDNTDKYALEDKSSKGVYNIYASVPEEHTLKQSRYIPSNYTEEQLIEHIKKPIYDYMTKKYGGMANEEMSDELINIIVSFHREYEKHFGNRHRVLTDKAYENIVDRYMNPPEEMADDYSIETYEAMMERYFEVNYNQRGNYKGNITLGLSHFMSDSIRSNLFYQTCY